MKDRLGTNNHIRRNLEDFINVFAILFGAVEE